jgi:DnaJ-class molecular chaperone
VIKSYISVIYHGSVIVPGDVYEAFGHTKEYEVFSASIMTKCNVASAGQNSYAEVEEWAEDCDKACVNTWISQWIKQIKVWQARITPCKACTGTGQDFNEGDPCHACDGSGMSPL